MLLLEPRLVGIERQQPVPAVLLVLAAERRLHLDHAGKTGAALEIARQPEQGLCISGK